MLREQEIKVSGLLWKADGLLTSRSGNSLDLVKDINGSFDAKAEVNQYLMIEM